MQCIVLNQGDFFLNRAVHVIPDFSTDLMMLNTNLKYGFSDDLAYAPWKYFWIGRFADLDAFLNLMEPRVGLQWANRGQL
jgi:hypothetical protein